MGLLDALFGAGKRRSEREDNLEKGLKAFRENEGGILADVRTKEEFAEGHLEGAVSLPLDELERIVFDKVDDPRRTLYLYCRTGNRAERAKAVLRGLGFADTVNIGGIEGYTGPLVRGGE